MIKRIWGLKFSLGMVFFLCLIQGYALHKWVKADTRPPAWDQAVHTQIAFDYSDRMTPGWWHKASGWETVLQPGYFNYPPLYHYALVKNIKKVSDVADAGARVNYFYLCVLLFAVFFIAEHFLSKPAALTSTILFSCYPIVMDISRQTLIDLSLTTWVSLSFLFLMKSDHFKNMVSSVLLGICLGFSVLTKWTAPAYILVPLLWSVVSAFKNKNTKWMWLSFLVSIPVWLPWYSINILPSLSRISQLSSLPPAGGLILTGWLKPLWYFIVLPEQLNLIFFLMALPAILFGLFNSRLRPVFLWFLFSLILFSLINNRNTRYSLPALPALAILSVAWVPSLFRLSYYFINMVCLVFFVMFQFFPRPWAPLNLGGFVIPIIDNTPPLAENWQHKEIIEKISENLDPHRKFTKVVFVSNAPFFHSTSINVTARTMRVKDFSFQGPSKKRWLDFADFILWKTGDMGPQFTIGEVASCSEFLSKPPDWFLKTYQVIGEWELPDHSKAVLFQWKPKPIKIPDVGMLNLNLGQFSLPNIQMMKVKLRAVPMNSQATAVGKLKELLFTCENAKYKDFTFENVSIRLINPQINLPMFLENQEISLASLEALELKTTLTDEGLITYAQKKLHWLKEPNLEFQDDNVIVQGKIKNIPMKIIAQVKINDNRLKPSIMGLQFGPLGIPHFVLNGLVNRSISLQADQEKPFDIRIQTVHGSGSKLKIE